MKAHVFDVLPEEYKPVKLYFNVNIFKMAYNDLKKEISWLWKTQLGGSKKQEKQYPKQKILALNSG